MVPRHNDDLIANGAGGWLAVLFEGRTQVAARRFSDGQRQGVEVLEDEDNQAERCSRR